MLLELGWLRHLLLRLLWPCRGKRGSAAGLLLLRLLRRNLLLLHQVLLLPLPPQTQLLH